MPTRSSPSAGAAQIEYERRSSLPSIVWRKRQVLAVREAELLGELCRDVERDDDGFVRFRPHAPDAQWMEVKCHG
jgi:hypothetical protein